jgi:hypothetical protein
LSKTNNQNISPAEYSRWIRERFPALNKSIDDGNGADILVLIQESVAASEAIDTDLTTDENERFTYLSMIHAALYRHKNAA